MDSLYWGGHLRQSERIFLVSLWRNLAILIRRTFYGICQTDLSKGGPDGALPGLFFFLDVHLPLPPCIPLIPLAFIFSQIIVDRWWDRTDFLEQDWDQHVGSVEWLNW